MMLQNINPFDYNVACRTCLLLFYLFFAFIPTTMTTLTNNTTWMTTGTDARLDSGCVLHQNVCKRTQSYKRCFLPWLPVLTVVVKFVLLAQLRMCVKMEKITKMLYKQFLLHFYRSIIVFFSLFMPSNDKSTYLYRGIWAGVVKAELKFQYKWKRISLTQTWLVSQ